MTNADRIRNMSDEELARWLHRTDHYYDAENGRLVVIFEGEEMNDEQISILEWLKKTIMR